MKFDFTKVTRALSSVGRALKNAAPEIAIVGGTVGLVASAVIACKETPKAMKTLNDHKSKMEIVDKSLKNGVTQSGEEYTEEDAKHDRVMITTQDGLAFIKIYAPALILGSVSIALILGGSKIFRSRVTALTSAYALIESRFSNYRNAVIEKFGSDIDKELRYKIKNGIIETTTVDENGEERHEIIDAKTTEYDGYSDYARIFDETNPEWRKNGLMNLTFLQQRQAWCNDKLRLKGYLFLNDVYDELNFERTPEGQLVGWVYDKNNPLIDNYISFGIDELYDRNHRQQLNDVMNDHERSFLLDFNCDGRILEKFKKFDKTVKH